MLEIPEVVSSMEHWIENDRDICHHVVNSGMHGLMEARKDPSLRRVFEDVDLFAPDGILMVIVARLLGFQIKKKNTGPDLLTEFARTANHHGYTNYFYGDEEPVLQRMETKLKKEFPNLKIVGRHSPPFRDLTPKEEIADIEAINQAAPDVLWGGLGMPKQEWWISKHRNELKAPVAVGAGAAFKFLSGDVSRGPAWLRNIGFEWLWRFLGEPSHIWKRVLVDAPRFIVLVALEIVGLKRFGHSGRDQ